MGASKFEEISKPSESIEIKALSSELRMVQETMTNISNEVEGL